MTKPKFNVGDTIVPIEPGRGLERATVKRINDKNYYLKIMHGIAIIPIGSQVIYKLEKSK